MQYPLAMIPASQDPTVIPREAHRWNWGAFLLNWIWGIGNNTPIALLALVPVVNLVIMVVLGAKGGEWAWRNKRWESVEAFRRVQHNWAIAGVLVWIVVIGLVAATAFGLVSMLRDSDVYRMALAKVQANEAAMRMLGAPIEGGIPMGSINISGPSGEAQLAIPVAGRQSKGTVYVEATRSMGQWRLDRIELEIEGEEKRIDLNSGRTILPPSASDKQALRATPRRL